MKTSLLASDQILRIESLGDNCELGFVLRNLGCEAGSLFRWASIKPEQLLSQLRAKFEGMYEFPNLQPLRNDMVVDTAYGVGWHSNMKSNMVEGQRRFLLDEGKRQKIYNAELRKIRYLRAKFVARAQLGGLIFVIKANDGINNENIEGIFEALSDLAAGARFALLEVQASSNPTLIGTVVQRHPGLLRGYVSRFASYDEANIVDMDAWTSVLDAALRLFACPDWSKRISDLHVLGTKINLAFPLGKSHDLTKPIPGDLRAGAAMLLHGNTWCRQVNDSFRLHGANPGSPGTLLRWTGVHAPGPCQLYGALHCPVEDSIAVEVVVTIRGDNGTVIAEWRATIAPHEPDDIALDFVPVNGQPVTIEMTVHAARPIKSSERAVVDVSPLSLDPTPASIVKPDAAIVVSAVRTPAKAFAQSRA
jgi:hypothetical protein